MDHPLGRLVRAIATAALIFISLPTLIVLVSSFSAGPGLRFPPPGFSIDPYAHLLQSSVIRGALVRSLTIGVESVIISLVVGVAASLSLFRYRVPLRSLITGYLMLGFSTPLVVSGMAFLVLYTKAGLIGSLWPLGLAVTIVNLPFLLFAVASSIEGLNPELEEAAATMGAENVQTFLFVTLPSLMPGILTGCLMMFIFAITEFLISIILSTTANQTLPVVIFGSLRGGLTPRLAAAGGLYIVIALIVVFLITRFRSLEQFLYRRD